jgi:alkylation response protein AidB-like acyl-CoA dehydrogenase
MSVLIAQRVTADTAVARAEVLAQHFAQRLARYDAAASFPRENFDELREAGLLAMTVPERYGGLGLRRSPAAIAPRRNCCRCTATPPA